jgi:hypothetical protein
MVNPTGLLFDACPMERVTSWHLPIQDFEYPTSYLHLGSFTLIASVPERISILPCDVTVNNQGAVLGLWEPEIKSVVPSVALKTGREGSPALFGLARLVKKGKILYKAMAIADDEGSKAITGDRWLLVCNSSEKRTLNQHTTWCTCHASSCISTKATHLLF